MTSPNEETLRGVPLFGGCSEADLALVAGLLVERTVPPGTVILPGGSDDDAWFVVLDGLARVVAGGREVGRLGPGDPFGEITMVDGTPTRGAVEALTAMTLACASASRLRELFSIGSIASVALQDLVGSDDG